MPDTRAKALGYLRDGAVAVLYARTERTADAPTQVVARVQGHNGRYVVGYAGQHWRCSAQPCLTVHDCAHIAAVQLITGHPSTAARPTKQERQP